MAEAFSNACNPSSSAGFASWWQLQGEWVEQPNERRGGYSGVQRITHKGQLLYAKRQTGHTYRSLKHPFGRPTVLRERDALLNAAQAGVSVPEIVYCAAEHAAEGWRALLVTRALEGFQPIDQWYAEHPRELCDERLHRQLLQRIAECLARLHKARLQHGCLYAKHIFVRLPESAASASCEVALLDLEKARRRLSVK